jgi:aminopeptidase-like protein
MRDILEAIYPLRLSVASPDSDRGAELFCRHLDFTVHEYASGSEVNGWVVPQSWQPVAASIRRGGRIVHDGMAHPLAVMGYSTSFAGTVGADELRTHLAYHPTLDDAVVYHCDYYYKASRRDWGFCVPRRLYDALDAGSYDVELVCDSRPGTMKVLDYRLPGRSAETILLNAHNCHAAQANDDMSGCVAGIEVMRRLARRNNRYTYRLIIAPEIYGPVFWLASLPKDEVRTLAGAILLKAVGSAEPLALQHSFTGTSAVDEAAANCFRFRHPGARTGAFRRIYGNDEIVFEAPGYAIPSISLTRYPFPQYHSSADDASVIDDDSLEEAVATTLAITDALEDNRYLRRRFDGLVSLSSPKYELYVPIWDPALRDSPEAGAIPDLHHLMTCLPRYLEGDMTILDIANKHALPFGAVHDYVSRFKDKGLIEFSDHRLPAPDIARNGVTPR